MKLTLFIFIIAILFPLTGFAESVVDSINACKREGGKAFFEAKVFGPSTGSTEGDIKNYCNAPTAGAMAACAGTGQNMEIIATYIAHLTNTAVFCVICYECTGDIMCGENDTSCGGGPNPKPDDRLYLNNSESQMLGR